MTGTADGGAIPADYHFSAVDGGATDNEPLELARQALAGLLGRNPRHPDEAHRAVLLVDPFAGNAPVTPAGVTGVVNTARSTLGALLQQTRYSTADLLLASDPSVFSHFMITPVRDGLVGGAAIAAGGLGAFIGFASPAFMRHDFLLGRLNCQQFLRDHFFLGAGNAVFDRWPAALKARLARPKDGMLPVIPLMGTAAVPESIDPWPKGALDPERYRDAIEARFRAVFAVEASTVLGSQVFGWIGAHVGQKAAADFAIKMMREDLGRWRLM